MEKPELMAPVGNWTMLKAAIDAGADAVYFGVKKLNMRAGAQNFSLEELSKVCALCHENKARAYLTLNTIVFENEIEDLKTILKEAKKAKIDAVICCDFSVISLAKKIGIPVCLSTQASVSNSEAVKAYENLGVRRVVLARECSLEQIREIVKKTKLEVEVFIHGAMCISVSGRCFLSHHAFGKSANRGECLQPCRSEYEIYDPDRKTTLLLGKDYILSPKDLCTIEFIDKIIETGVHALKIEGRKRSPEYVSTVVSAYKQAIDLYFENKLTEGKKKELLEKLKTVYNRGFSTGFYFGQPSADEYATKPGSIATTRKTDIGKVINFYKEKGVILLKLESESLKTGDKIMFQGPTTGVFEYTIKEMQVNERNSKKAVKGDLVCVKSGNLVRRNDRVYLIKQSSENMLSF